MTTPPPSIETDPNSAWQDGYDLGLEHGEQLVEKPSRGLWMLAGAGIVIAVQVVIAAIGFAVFAFALKSEDVSAFAYTSEPASSVAKATTAGRAVPEPLTAQEIVQTCQDAAAAIEVFASMDPSGNPDRQAIAASVLEMIKDGGDGFAKAAEESGWEVTRDSPIDSGRTWTSLTLSQQLQVEDAVAAAASGDC